MGSRLIDRGTRPRDGPARRDDDGLDRTLGRRKPSGSPGNDAGGYKSAALRAPSRKAIIVGSGGSAVSCCRLTSSGWQ